MLLLVSKKGCSPCEFLKSRFERDLPPSKFKVLTFDTDQEVFDFLAPFNRKSVPTVITESNEVLNFKEAINYIKNI